MKIQMDELIKTIAVALDLVEEELLGATTNHGKRIAVLTYAMGCYHGLSNDELIGLTTCALFHDNALTEFILSQKPNKYGEISMKEHCVRGQQNVESLKFQIGVKDFVLYHHERADGKGAFGKKEGEYPLEAELIALADYLDVTMPLQNVLIADKEKIKDFVKHEIGRSFTSRAADSFLSIFTKEMLVSLRDENIKKTAKDLIPPWSLDSKDLSVKNLADFVASIIDCKSNFTRIHSTEISQKLLSMCDFYHLDEDTRAKAYLASALHDIGKLHTPTEILEKEDKLTEEEFIIIKEHVFYTYKMLMEIDGFEEICQWASNHHEKLNGTGYPFGKQAEDLDFISRLMGCLDIYQAVGEKRPYHPQREHSETMSILYGMSDKGLIDSEIVKDIDFVFQKKE